MHSESVPPPPPPPYDAVVGTTPGLQQPSNIPSRFSLSTFTPRQKTSLNVSSVAAFLSASFIYEYFFISEGFDVDVFHDTMQIARLALGAVGSLCLISTVMVKYLIRTRTDLALALSLAGTLFVAGYVGLAVVIHEGASIFEHASWPFYTSIAAVLMGTVGSYLCFMEFQQHNQRVQSQTY